MRQGEARAPEPAVPEPADSAEYYDPAEHYYPAAPVEHHYPAALASAGSASGSSPRPVPVAKEPAEGVPADWVPAGAVPADSSPGSVAVAIPAA